MKFAAVSCFRRLRRFAVFAPIFFLLGGCDQAPPPATSVLPAVAPAKGASSYEIVHTYPHDRGAFTEGLFFLNGALYESTGLNGESSVRKVDLETGKVLQHIDVPPEYFGEGLAQLNGKLYQLTWKHGIAFRYDLNTFNQDMQFNYPGEGWGLTTDGRYLIMSDGTDQIRFINPLNFETVRTINVTYQGQPVSKVNELEYIKGQIYANIWTTDYMIKIDPATGKVGEMIDLSGLLKPEDRDATTDVLNGIAYDPATDRIFVTGKKWPKLFEIRIKGS